MRRASLRSAAQIERVFKLGQRYRTPDIGLWVLAADSPTPRLAISVRRGLRATERNRVRRRVREALRRAEPTGGVDGVVVVGSSIQVLPFDELQRQMCQILEEAGLRKR